MKRRLALLAFLLALFPGYALAAALATSEETHEVPFTIGDVTGTYTFTDTDTDVTVTETVTETQTVTVTETSPPPPAPPPPAPPPPPPPPPPPSGGTLIEVGQPTTGRAAWTCNRPLSSYAVDGFPLTVRVTWTGPWHDFGFFIASGCTGPGTLILEDNADGLTRGPNEDALRLANAGTSYGNFTIKGHINCGPRTNSNTHQDGVQVLGGINIVFEDFHVGFYALGLSTCQGAGGAMFYSLASQNIDVIGGSYIACNHSLLAGTSSPGAEVRDASFRSGRNDGTDPVCNYASSDPCLVQPAWGGETSNLTCERWINGSWQTRNLREASEAELARVVELGASGG